MTPGAAHAAPRGAQASSKGAQEPHRSSQDALKSSLEGHIGCKRLQKCTQEGPKACTGASHEALCRASSAQRRGYKTVLGTKLAQTCSQHHEGPVQLDMWI